MSEAPEAGVTGGCELCSVELGTSLDPLEEQCVLLTREPAPQPSLH